MPDVIPCSVPGCEKPKSCRGLCPMHYERWRRYGDVGPVCTVVRRHPPECSVPGCGRKVFARDWCYKHWRRWRKHGDPNQRYAKSSTVLFWEKVNKDGPIPERCPERGPCWEWTATRAAGYGRVGIDGQIRPAQQVAYELLVGPIPEGLELDHLCMNPPCVNPTHLEPVTRAENARRAQEAYRKTHCARGHEFTEENTVRIARGTRECRECKNARARERYWRRKAG